MNDLTNDLKCSLSEALIYQIALTIEDGIVAFHGFGSPLVQLALHLAKQTFSPDIILVAGATYGINPKPEFLTPTSNDWAMSQNSECFLDIEELFDLAASGRMGRMFLSGLQIDRWGNMNVTQLGKDKIKLKLPGGGGGCNLSCDVNRLTLWTASHRTIIDQQDRRRYRLVNHCDFITNLGYRTKAGKHRDEFGFKGLGPDRLITELGVFDFDDKGHVRLIAVYPDTNHEMIKTHTEFDFPVAENVETIGLPDSKSVQIIRSLDPLNIREKEINKADRLRHFAMS